MRTEQSKKNFVVMSGVAGSGKSTYIEENLQGYTVIGFDNTLNKVFNFGRDALNVNHHLFSYDEMNEMWVALSSSDKAWFKQLTINKLEHALKNGHNIVFDQTNLTNAIRIKRLKGVNRDNYKTTLVMIKPDKDSIFKIADKRVKEGKYIPTEVIKRMINDFEHDTSTINHKFDEVIMHSVSPTEDDISIDKLLLELGKLSDIWGCDGDEDRYEKYSNIEEHIDHVLKVHENRYISMKQSYISDGDYYTCHIFSFIDNNKELHLITVEIEYY